MREVVSPLHYAELSPNKLFLGDNLDVMKQLYDKSIDLIYIDPPFFTNKNYQSFSDVWKGGLEEYLLWLMIRIKEMRRLLKESGCIYVHCDWHASHYIKIELDKLFGYDNFRNEIIWHYNSGARKKLDFGKRHDVIFRYSRTNNYFVDFDNKLAREPYSPKISIPASKAHYYDCKGKVIDDVWNIPIIAQNDKTERVGYPTQKPESLLERIIAISCPLNGVVADFFCGSGTTAVVANRLGRQWIVSDKSEEAIKVTMKRIEK